MKIIKTIEEEIDINWEEIYQTVKKDYDEWIQYNIDNNVNPLNHSFDYNESEELPELFGTNIETYIENYDDSEIITDFMTDSYVKEFVEYIKNRKL